jgi:hypothetical protein
LLSHNLLTVARLPRRPVISEQRGRLRYRSRSFSCGQNSELTQKKKTMKQEITIAGVQYPVTFEFQTLLNFESITNSSFFDTNFTKTVDRMALIMAAVLTADEDTKLTVDLLKGKGDWDAVKDIIAAYSVVMDLASAFFKVPEVVKQAEENEAEGQKNDTGEQPKND